MDPIKEAMQQVYEEGHFSQAKKNETLANVQKPSRSWNLSYIVPAVVGCAMLGIVWALLQFQPQYDMAEKDFASSAAQAPYDSVIAMAERKLQFQQIIEDGEITELEKVDYLRTSDWKLQLAFETQSSETYEIPNDIEPAQLAKYAQLLYLMREYIYDEEVHEEVFEAFKQSTTFKEMPKLIPVLDAYVLTNYVSSIDEDKSVSKYFETFPMAKKIIWIVVVLLLCAWTIWNMLRRRKMALFVLQIILICIIAAIWTRPIETYSAYDETSLYQASEEIMKKYGSEFSHTELLDSATFDNKRYALIQLHDSKDTKYALLTFQRQDNMYVFTEMQWMRDDKTWVVQDFNRNNGQKIFLLALVEGHKAVKAEVTVYTNPSYSYQVDLDPSSTLQAIYLPQNDKSMEIKLYDAQGQRMTQ